MVILGKTEFGHLETEGEEKFLVPGQSDDKDSVTVMLDFKNDGPKTIDAVIFFFLPYDAVDHIVYSGARKQSETRLRFVGVIQPNEIKRNVYWENVWYSHDIAQIKLMRVDITYTDGSTRSLNDCQIHFECA